MHGQKIKATCAGIQNRVADDQDSAELTSKSFSFILILYFSCVLDIWLASDRPIWRARSSSSSMPALSPVAWHLRVCERHIGAGKLQAKNLVDTFEASQSGAFTWTITFIIQFCSFPHPLFAPCSADVPR